MKHGAHATAQSDTLARRKHGVGWVLAGLIMELLFTLAIACGLYILWQMWWTGVVAEHVQEQTRQSVAWSAPSSNQGEQTQVATAQEGDPPVQPESAQEGDLVAQIYIPRFGSQWVRNIVEGTTVEQLNRHGMGHYERSQMPGAVGNFAVAGHRNGYGQPLGDIDKLQEGDPIIIRTRDYWYVYHFTRYIVVTPDHGEVVAANPDNPGQPAVKRMLTLTTCEPKYSAPIYRWISYGELSAWYKVAEGVPPELAQKDDQGKVQFINKEQVSVAARLDSLQPVVMWALIAYAIIFIAAALVWRWPLLRAIKEGRKPRPDFSCYGWLVRHQPGPAGIRWILVALLAVAAAAAALEWVCPYLASTVPILKEMSNYVAV